MFRNEKMLSEQELLGMKHQLEVSRILHILDLQHSGRQVFRLMYIYEGAWRISGIAEYTGIARSTVADTLERNIQRGLMRQSDAGYTLTKEGRGFMSRIHREISAVAIGEREGLSRELVQFLRDNDLGRPGKDALKIQSPKIPDYKPRG